MIIHVSTIKRKHFKYLAKAFHVPTFIFLSFYFYYRILYNKAITKIIERFKRLLIPYIIYPIIILIVNDFLIPIFSLDKLQIKLALKIFYIQILIGGGNHKIFWFQFNLIFLSLFFAIISFIFKQNLLRVLAVLGIISSKQDKDNNQF